jgi:hypothetical protein
LYTARIEGSLKFFHDFFNLVSIFRAGRLAGPAGLPLFPFADCILPPEDGKIIEKTLQFVQSCFNDSLYNKIEKKKTDGGRHENTGY